MEREHGVEQYNRAMNNTGKVEDEGVSLGGTTGEWAPPESKLTLRIHLLSKNVSQNPSI